MLEHSLLRTLVHVPFLSLANASLLLGEPPATVARAAARLRAKGLVERVPIGRDRTCLYCLTDDGVIAVAHAHRCDPAALATRYDLGRRALLARLPALDRALDAQNAFVPLVRAHLSAPAVTLHDYRLGALRWGRWASEWLTLDGQIALELAGRRYYLGLLWDGDEDVPATILHERLCRLERLDDGPRVPPVLLVTCDSRRVPWPYPGYLLWTTEAEVWVREPPAVRWILPTVWTPGMRRDRPQTRALLDALATTRGQDLVHDATHLTPRAVQPGQQLGLERRLTALRHGAPERHPTPPGLLALALPPRAIAVLAVVGRHPLLRAPQIAEVCACPPARTRATLALLTAHELVDPQECGAERVGRYVLTARGLHLLAARAGLSVATYRASYGVLEDRLPGVRRGLDFAAANLAHTTALQEVFLVLLRAARAHGVHMSWRGEWACVRTFAWQGERHVLRPDAEVIYDDGTRQQQILIELDRSTVPLEEIAAQLRRYHRYALSQAEQTGGRPQMRVAFVTVKSEERARHIAGVGEAVRRDEGDSGLDLLATTLKRLLRSGPQGRIWWRGGGTELTWGPEDLHAEHLRGEK